MPGHIRRKRRTQLITSLIICFVFICGWMLEERFLRSSGWQRPQGQLTSGEYRVEQVIDGDTIVLEQNDLRVRLQGIDTPETVARDAQVESWGPEASEYTKDFIESANWLIRLEIDGEAVDRYGRHLAFVWHDGRLLNEELVLQGLARAKTTFDYSQTLKQRLLQAEFKAQTALRGLWSRSSANDPRDRVR